MTALQCRVCWSEGEGHFVNLCDLHRAAPALLAACRELLAWANAGDEECGLCMDALDDHRDDCPMRAVGLAVGQL